MFYLFLLVVLAAVHPAFAQTSHASLTSTAVAIPNGQEGIGFDDLVYCAQLHKILVPAGHTGKLYLIDPVSMAMDSIGGFTSSAHFQKGHHTGVSTADEGDGYIFTADHGTKMLMAVDMKTGKVAAQTPLMGQPDIIRYAASQREVWVTEPDDLKQIEIFRFNGIPSQNPKSALPLEEAAIIKVHDGPESLTMDDIHQKAYTNLGDNTAIIDLKTHTVANQWPSTCQKSRGTAIDEGGNVLIVACAEGKAVSFDLNQNGKLIGSLSTGPGSDLVYFNAQLSHFYITGSKDASLSVLGVSAKGELSLLGTGKAATRAHCVVGDDQNNIWVCDPPDGQLLRFKDNFPKI